MNTGSVYRALVHKTNVISEQIVNKTHYKFLNITSLQGSTI